MKNQDINNRMRLSRRTLLYVACLLLSQVTSVVAADALNDPTRPPLTSPSRVASKVAAAAVEPTILTAVLFSEARRVAVIGGRVLREGDHFGGATVTRIDIDKVTLTKAGRTEVMRLPKTTLLIKSSSATENQP